MNARRIFSLKASFILFFFAVSMVQMNSGSSRAQSEECFTGPEPSDDPPSLTSIWTLEAKEDALDTALVAPGWERLELVKGNILSLGWEDSANISLDGTTLSFMYLQTDVLSFVQRGGADPSRFDEFRRGPDRGNRPSYTTDFYSASFSPDGLTCRPSPFPFSQENRFEWGGMQDPDGNWYYVASPLEHQPDIYRNDEKLPFNTAFEEDDPHYDRGSKTLLFDSQDRPGVLNPGNKKDIWMTKEMSPGIWSIPVLLNAPINLAASDDRQAHLTQEGKLYFTSDRENDALAIYVSQRLGTNSWSQPVKVIGPSPVPQPIPEDLLLIAVGEPTLTASGRLYFVALFFHPPTQAFDLDIARMSPGR